MPKLVALHRGFAGTWPVGQGRPLSQPARQHAEHVHLHKAEPSSTSAYFVHNGIPGAMPQSDAEAGRKKRSSLLLLHTAATASCKRAPIYSNIRQHCCFYQTPSGAGWRPMLAIQSRMTCARQSNIAANCRPTCCRRAVQPGRTVSCSNCVSLPIGGHRWPKPLSSKAPLTNRRHPASAGSGTVDLREVKNVLASMSSHQHAAALADDDVARMFKAVDADDSGDIDFHEFCQVRFAPVRWHYDMRRLDRFAWLDHAAAQLRHAVNTSFRRCLCIHGREELGT